MYHHRSDPNVAPVMPHDSSVQETPHTAPTPHLQHKIPNPNSGLMEMRVPTPKGVRFNPPSTLVHVEPPVVPTVIPKPDPILPCEPRVLEVIDLTVEPSMLGIIREGVKLGLPEFYPNPLVSSLCDPCGPEDHATLIFGVKDLGWQEQHSRMGHYPHDPRCSHCVQARLKERARKRQLGRVIEGPGEGLKISSDLMGPFPACLLAKTFAMNAIDSESSWCEVDGVEGKGSAETSKVFESLIADLRIWGNQPNKRVVRIHTDMGGEYKKHFQTLCKKLGARKTGTGGYMSKANPQAELFHQLGQGGMRALLGQATHGSDLYFKDLWLLALKHHVFWLNRAGSKDRESPYKKVWGKDYEVHPNDHNFGSLCYYKIDKVALINKGDMRGEPAIWVGRDLNTGGHIVVPISWVYNENKFELFQPKTVKTVKVEDGNYILRKGPGRNRRGCDDTLDEFVDRCWPTGGDLRGAEEDTPNPAVNPETGSSQDSGTKANPNPTPIRTGEQVNSHPNPDLPHDGGDEADPSDLSEEEGEDRRDWEVDSIVGKARPWYGNGRAGPRTTYYIKWKGCGTITSETLESGNLDNCLDLIDEFEGRANLRVQVLMEATSEDSERTVLELLKRDPKPGDVKDWVKAVDLELKTVGDKRLRELFGAERENILRGPNVMKLRMLLEIKRSGRLKGRLVGQGFLEDGFLTKGLESSPVLRQEVLRALVFNAGLGEEFASIDVTTAFLQALSYLDSDPPRYATYRPFRGAPVRVFQLTGPLYGQRDAPRRWYETVMSYLTKPPNPNNPKEGGLGFTKSPNDPSSFVHKTTGVRLGLVVDDILARGPPGAVRAFMESFREHFDCTEPNYLTDNNSLEFSGFRLTRETLSNGDVGYYLDQEGDVDQFIIENGIEWSGSEVGCPMPSSRRSDLFRGELLDEVSKSRYKSIVGGLSWFGSSLRWDLRQSISRLQQVSSKPTVGSMECAVRVCLYLKSTQDFRLGGPRTESNEFKYYSDSDFAGDRELTKNSRSGGMITLNSVPISWFSTPQPKTVYSPAAAEIYALREMAREGQGINWVCRDLGMGGVPSPFCVQVDNAQVEAFVSDSCVRSKHFGMIDMAETWVAELRDDSILRVEHVAGHLNLADIMTKSMDKPEFIARRDLVTGSGRRNNNNIMNKNRINNNKKYNFKGGVELHDEERKKEN